MLEYEHMLAPLKLFATKLAIFSIVLLYLALDLWAFQGPVWKLIHSDAQLKNDQDPRIATLYGKPLRQSDWEAQAAAMAYERGLESMPESARASVLMELLRRELLAIRVHYNENNVTRFHDEARAEMARMASRAPSPEAWKELLASRGMTEESYLADIEATLRQEYLLSRSIQEATRVTDEEVAQYYEALKEQLRIPASRRARHLFLRALNQDPAALQQRAEALYQRVLTGESLADLARQYSDDSATAAQGGDLGVLYDSVELPLPELDLFGEQAIAAATPVLKKSRWGWHIVQAAAPTPSRLPRLEEAAPSLRTALESARRSWASDHYFQSSFRELFHDKHLKINK